MTRIPQRTLDAVGAGDEETSLGPFFSDSLVFYTWARNEILKSGLGFQDAKSRSLLPADNLC